MHPSADRHATLIFSVPAAARAVPGVRRRLAQFAEAHGLPEARIWDLEIAATEACTNAVRHAYPTGQGGAIEVEARAENGELVLVVRDHGDGLMQPSASPGLGQGIVLMHALGDAAITETDPHGVTVEMHFALPACQA